MKWIIFIAILFLSGVVFADDVRVCQTEKIKYQYRIELATLILSKTSAEYGPAGIVPYDKKDPSQSRGIALLKQNQVDLLYLPVTGGRLKTMASVKIDIHNGMLGYRVFIINKQDKALFAGVKTLDDLRKFKGGFGKQWGDFKIFALNNLPVEGRANTNTLLKMLNQQRFDYFHRGLHEAWAEVEAVKEKYPNLMVEETIALIYDFPVYFMFNKNNKKIKNRFEDGFKIILKDGSFRELYNRHFEHLAKKADLNNRTIIRIKYPVPQGLPPIDTSLWLD